MGPSDTVSGCVHTCVHVPPCAGGLGPVLCGCAPRLPVSCVLCNVCVCVCVFVPVCVLTGSPLPLPEDSP